MSDSPQKVAVVTGANRGIGFEIVRQLATALEHSGLVYLTARDEGRGQAALKKLQRDGHSNVLYHQLDITDPVSCHKCFDDISSEHPHGIDILVNNAGIAFLGGSNDPIGTEAEITMGTNFFGTQRVSQIAFPLLVKNARVVNASSMLGHLSRLSKGKEPEASVLRAKLADPNISLATLNDLAIDFVKAASTRQHFDQGWINSPYAVSKMLIAVLTRIEQREVDKARPNDNILVNAVHPGYVATNMTGNRGEFAPTRGAQPSVYCALIPPGQKEPHGAFIWHDNRTIDFTADSLPID